MKVKTIFHLFKQLHAVRSSKMSTDLSGKFVRCFELRWRIIMHIDINSRCELFNEDKWKATGCARWHGIDNILFEPTILGETRGCRWQGIIFNLGMDYHLIPALLVAMTMINIIRSQKLKLNVINKRKTGTKWLDITSFADVINLTTSEKQGFTKSFGYLFRKL